MFGPTKLPSSASTTLVLRRATAADAGAVITHAHLDSAPVPRGDVVLAEVGEETWAAVSLEDFQVVADPFRPAGDVVFTLLERARQLKKES